MPPKGSKRKLQTEDKPPRGRPTENGSPDSLKEKKRKAELVTGKEVPGPEEPPGSPVSKPRPLRGQQVQKIAVKEQGEDKSSADEEKAESPARGEAVKNSRKRKQTKEEEPDEVAVEGAPEKKAPKKRKTKEEKEADNMPLAARTVGHKLFIGAHVSSAGGVQNAVANSLHIGANAFALFLKSQRKWANPPLAEDACTAFRDNCKSHSYDQTQHTVPHGSYLVNLAHTDKERTTQAYTAFLDDLQRCERLGIKLYNFHPGNTVSKDRSEAIAHLASNLNAAHKATSSVVTLLENMAAGGNVLGSTFEDLRDIISHIEDKSRVGVCLDTCHAFAGGYDLRSPEAFQKTLQRFDDVVGMKYLRALHLNDSKAPFDSHRDLHANIGTGFLGLRAFHNVVNEPRFAGLPLVLETPIEVSDEDGVPVKDEKGKVKEDKGIWAKEIKMLEGLVGVDVGDEHFKQMEAELWRKGVPQRSKLEEQIGRKKEKEEKKARSPRKKGAKGRKVKEESADEESSGLSEMEES